MQAQKALQTDRPHLTSRRTPFDYRTMQPKATARPAEVEARLKQQPELENLFKAMGLRLADFPQRDKNNAGATFLDQLPKLKDSKVRQPG